MTESKIREESFTNSLGQVFSPGEEVLFAGSSQKSTSIRKGIYAGLRYGPVSWYEPKLDKDGKQILKEYKQWGGSGTYTIPETEQKFGIKPVACVIKNVHRGKKYGYKDGEFVEIGEQYGTSTLKLMRIYKLDTPFAELVGSYF